MRVIALTRTHTSDDIHTRRANAEGGACSRHQAAIDPSIHLEASVHVDDFTRDEPREWRRKEVHAVGNLFRLTETAHGDLLQQLGALLLLKMKMIIMT